MNNFFCLLKLRSDQLQPWCSDASASHADLSLHQFDELNELWDGIHSQQWQEPTVQFERLLIFSLDSTVEQVYGFARQSVREAGDPSGGSNANRFQDRVVYADANLQSIADERANR